MSESINNNTVASQTPNNNISPLEDGGSSAGLTQGEIVFVTLTCFIVAVATIFAIYVVHRKRRQRAEENQKNNDTPTSTQLNSPPVNSTVFNEMGKYPTAGSIHDTSRGYSFTGNHRPTFESEDSRMNRRRDNIMNTVESQGSGGKKSRRSSKGSAGSNVSNQYKVAAMDKMRHMSEVSDL